MKINNISVILFTGMMATGTVLAQTDIPVREALWQYGQVDGDNSTGHSVSMDDQGRLYVGEFIKTGVGKYIVGFSVFDTVKKEKKWFVSLPGAEENNRSMLITAPIIDTERQRLWAVTRDSRIYLYDISGDTPPRLLKQTQLGERKDSRRDFTRAETTILPDDGQLIVTTCGRQPDGNPEPEIYSRLFRVNSSLTIVDAQELGVMQNIPGSSDSYCKSFDKDMLKYHSTIPVPGLAYIPRYNVIDTAGERVNPITYRFADGYINEWDVGGHTAIPFATGTDLTRYYIADMGELKRQKANEQPEKIFTTGESKLGQFATLYSDTLLMVTKKSVAASSGHYDTFLTALDKDQDEHAAPLWQLPLSTFDTDLHDGYFRNRPTKPVVSQKGTLYIADQDALTAINVKNQQPLWRYVVPENSRPNEMVLDLQGNIWMTQCLKQPSDAAADYETMVKSANCQLVVLGGDGTTQMPGSLSERGDQENTGRLYSGK
ncbi:TPA: hypothetical protein ACOQZT_003209 [Serratia odorifera]